MEWRDPVAKARDVGFCAFLQQPVRRIEFPFGDDPLQGGSSRRGISGLLFRRTVKIRTVFQQNFRALRRPVKEGVGKGTRALIGIVGARHFSGFESALQQKIQNGVTVEFDGSLDACHGDSRRNGRVAGGQLPNDF